MQSSEKGPLETAGWINTIASVVGADTAPIVQYMSGNSHVGAPSQLEWVISSLQIKREHVETVLRALGERNLLTGANIETVSLDDLAGPCMTLYEHLVAERQRAAAVEEAA